MLKLKVRQTVGRAYTLAEKDRMLAVARRARSLHIYPALTLALNAGLRDAEIKNLTWGQIDFTKKYLAVGRSKTDAGEGRTIPLNSILLEVFSEYREWYYQKFGKPRGEWYIFPFGKPNPSDPTRPVTTLKTAWNTVRTKAMVMGRWHDNRHTLITELAESGAGDQTIMDIAGHASKQEAKRSALEAIVNRRPAKDDPRRKEQVAASQEKPPGGSHSERRPVLKDQTVPRNEVISAPDSLADLCSETPTDTPHFDVEYPQKSPQSVVFVVEEKTEKPCKSMNLNGGRGRNRTYNLSVKSCTEANSCWLLQLSAECSGPRVCKGSASSLITFSSCRLLSSIPGIFPGNSRPWRLRDCECPSCPPPGGHFPAPTPFPPALRIQILDGSAEPAQTFAGRILSGKASRRPDRGGSAECVAFADKTVTDLAFPMPLTMHE